MKDVGKAILIEVLGLEKLGLVPFYEAAGFFKAADESVAGAIMGAIEAFTDALKLQTIAIDGIDSEDKFNIYAATMAAVGTAIDEHLEIAEQAVFTGL